MCCQSSWGPNLPPKSWPGSPNNRRQTSLPPRSRRRKSFTELNCSPKVSGATPCWLQRKGCLRKTSRDAYSHSRVTLRAILPALQRTVGRLEDLSATRMPRSRPLRGRMGLSLQQGMAPTLPIAALLSSIPGARPREKARDASREAWDRPDPTNTSPDNHLDPSTPLGGACLRRDLSTRGGVRRVPRASGAP